jgi:hypothetical protein
MRLVPTGHPPKKIIYRCSHRGKANASHLRKIKKLSEWPTMYQLTDNVRGYSVKAVPSVTLSAIESDTRSVEEGIRQSKLTILNDCGPPASRSVSQWNRYRSFHRQAKIVRKTLIYTVLFCDFLMTFYLQRMM